jgi:hypothetical protein
MDQFENLARTYSQAPWRRQLQVIALFLLIVVLIALVAGVYLSISAKSTAVGRDIQAMQSEIAKFDRENEDLQSQLAKILSSSQMEMRAENLGFVEVPPDQIVYLNVPGYVERQPVILAPSNERQVISAVSIPPEYTESIFEWLARKAVDWYSSIIEEKP